MNENDHKVIEAMIVNGGSFVHNLGLAASHADAENLAKIKRAWPKYWKEYGGEVEELDPLLTMTVEEVAYMPLHKILEVAKGDGDRMNNLTQLMLRAQQFL